MLLGFDWFDWIILIKSEILITMVMFWPVRPDKWKAPLDNTSFFFFYLNLNSKQMSKNFWQYRQGNLWVVEMTNFLKKSIISICHSFFKLFVLQASK